MKKAKISYQDLVPFIILAVMLVIFGIATGGSMFSSSNMKGMFNQAACIIMAGFGMVFATTMGATDITHGALLCLSGGLGCMAAAALGGWATFPVAILLGIGSGLILGTCNAVFRASSFMMSLALLIAYKAMNSLIFNSVVVSAPRSLKFIDGIGFKLAVVVILFLITLYIYNYMPYGTHLKAVGENENAVKHCGINIRRVKMIAFVISGIMCAIAAVFNAVRVGGITNQIGTGFEMNVMMAMFIGGIPVEGGMKSKLYKLVIGAFTIIILTNGLMLCGASGGLTQLIKGIILLAVVALTQFMNTKLSSIGEQAAVNQAKVAQAEE